MTKPKTKNQTDYEARLAREKEKKEAAYWHGRCQKSYADDTVSEVI